MRYGHIYSHLFETKLTFRTNLINMTCESYLKQPKSMLDWRLIEKLARNPNLIKAFVRNISHPLIREYCLLDPVENQSHYSFILGVN